jgi:cell division protein FtsZ
MAVGRASGEDRARAAAEQAITSNLLDITIDGARGILFNITGGPDLSLFEVNNAAAIIKETAHPDVNLIFGAVIDPEMDEDIRLTVIATGFDRAGMPRRITRTRPQQQTTHSQSSAQAPIQQQSMRELEPATFNPEDLDIPTFLRKRVSNK